ncbi:hypothetical protein [Granulicella sp. dw_53]|uniref:DUF6908 domain-containing protein n=1 Tax=Granulicella sp. dw_53 TaxID=2719792 RepID=UPI001BD573C4|nr:hypothetical protein [Granulicella sp. dw_53]
MYVHAAFHDMQKQRRSKMRFLKQLTKLQPELLVRVETTVKIHNSPYMTLTVENIGLGPRGLPALSICHYGEQNGDLMRDPEMCFEVEIENGIAMEFQPYFYRNDYAGVEQNAVEDKIVNTRMIRSQRQFSELWSPNLIEQGFLTAYLAQANDRAQEEYFKEMSDPERLREEMEQAQAEDRLERRHEERVLELGIELMEQEGIAKQQRIIDGRK